MPQKELLGLLEGIGGGKIGMDSAILDTRHKGLKLVQTTDFFYPLVEDPYKQGQIACANVLSDLYAMGVSVCDNMLMILAASREMEYNDRMIVTRLLIQGFADHAATAGTSVTGGQTVLNPWPIIGGVATSVCAESEIIVPTKIVPGCVMVLTKALGTQIAVNLRQWTRKPDRWAKVQDHITAQEADDAYLKAEKSMIRLNNVAAELMHVHGSLGATDVTGFGIIGHASNLAENQEAAVVIELHTLPVIANMVKIETVLNHPFNLLKGRSAETSGGLLLALPSEDAAKAYIRDIKAREGQDAWIVGIVLHRDASEYPKNTAVISQNPTIIDV